MANFPSSKKLLVATLLLLAAGNLSADGKFAGVYGLRFDGTFDPFPTCFSPNIAFIFIEELDSVLMWEGDELSVNVLIDEVCVPNASFQARFTYSMFTPDSSYLQGETANLELSGLDEGADIVARTVDNGEFDGSRILLVSRDNVSVTGDITIDSLRVFNALSVEIIDPPNFAPIAADDQASTLVDRPVPIPVLNNDSDANTGDTLSIASVNSPTVGQAAISGSLVIYTPPAGTHATATFQYTATDGALTSNSAMVTVSVVTRGSDLIFFESNEP